MRVNSRVLSEKSDLMGNIQIPTCPSQFRGVAENLMTMLTKLDYKVSGYTNVTELDKILTIDYWREYDGLDNHIEASKIRDWFIRTSTPADLISRARRWLQERNYIFLEDVVVERATKASDKWHQSVSQ